SSRLVRGWTHLDREKGGIGMRGPGETQLESDRRMVRERIQTIKKRLQKVRVQRGQSRRSRDRAEIPTLSLVGYTNAGKSTLFNRMTGSDVFAADQLFATLDPTMRRLELAEVGPVIFADTVGFISHLPHRLVDAFRATLEEAASATLLLHVVDAAAEERAVNIQRVNEVLKDIDAHGLPTLILYNKIDLLDGTEPRIERNTQGVPVAVWLSAQTGQGLDLLLQAIVECLPSKTVHRHLQLQPHQGALRAALYSQKAVVAEQITDQGTINLEIKLAESDFLRLLKNSGLKLQDLDTMSG
ncbi:MAG: GTPase HflX, partial [Porticoccaceae bacterium]